MRILIFGNAGSGKTTLARRLGAQHRLALLDLDNVIWGSPEVDVFRPDTEIIEALAAFARTHPSWVIEGCYGRWMEHLLPHCTEIVFLNPGLEVCLANCHARPWEPNKFKTKDEQDRWLPALLDWVRAYYTRTDDLSLSAHRRLFESYNGARQEVATEQEVGRFVDFVMNSSTTEQSPQAHEATPFDDGALYDLFFERLDIGLDFYLGLAKAADGPVLDVACGTGRILLPCLKAGLDVEGLDLFPNMLARLRKKASALGFEPKLYESNMAGFQLPRRYTLITITFNAFVHNLTTEDQLATLNACREHLLPGGMLVFDTAFPGPHWIAQPSGTREMEMEIAHPETGLPVRMWDTRTFDRVKQIQHSFTEIEMLDATGKVIATHPSRTTIRWIYKAEMELLLRTAGFVRWEILGDFDGRPLERETDAMIVKAWTARDAEDKKP